MVHGYVRFAELSAEIAGIREVSGTPGGMAVTGSRQSRRNSKFVYSYVKRKFCIFI
jgi:hypothetical protein